LIDKLIVYSFCSEDEIKCETGVDYIRALIERLKKDIPEAENLPGPENGNANYPESRDLILRVMDCVAKHNRSKRLEYEDLRVTLREMSNYLSGDTTRDFALFLRDGLWDPIERIARTVDFEPEFYVSILLTGQRYDLHFPYGVATMGGAFCLNRNVERLSIWHETAHLLGADDHYDKQHQPIRECTLKERCIMQWISTLGHDFCSFAIKQMSEFLAKG